MQKQEEKANCKNDTEREAIKATETEPDIKLEPKRDPQRNPPDAVNIVQEKEINRPG